jgi:hypothetical protein
MSPERITRTELFNLAREEGYEVADAEDGQRAPLHDAAVEGVVDEGLNGVRLTSLEDVTMRRARFAWTSRIPLGTITLVAGLPGFGKSHLTVHLGARITRGQLEGDLRGAPSDIVVASAEDALEFVLKPRFVAAGADIARVYSIKLGRDGVDLGISIPDDIEGIKRRLVATEARLLVIDPLLAHIPMRVDGHKDQHVRTALAPLSRMAEELDIAVVCVMHLNKRETADLFSRVGGSGGFTAAARSALLVAEDPDDADVRVVAHGKSNLTPTAESLAFRLEGIELPNPDPEDPEPIEVAKVVIIGDSDRDVESLLEKRSSSAGSDAKAWLAQYLAAGPVLAETLFKDGREAGHSKRTVERAKKALGVKSDREGGIGGSGRWFWSL